MNKIFGAFSKAIPHAQPNTGVHDMVMGRLRKTYIACGGNIKDEEAEIIEGLPRFEAAKYILSRKLEATRSALSRLDDIKGHVAVRRKQNVRKMLVALTISLRLVEEEFIKIEKPPLRWLKMNSGPDPEFVEARREEFELCKKHVEEVHLLYKSRYRDGLEVIPSFEGSINKKKKKKKNKKKNLGKIAKLIGGGSSDEDNEEEDEFSDYSSDDLIVKESDGWMDHVALPGDPEASNLPAIDCHVAIKKVKENRKQMHEKMGLFNNKLDEMKEHARQMGELIEESEVIAEEVGVKIDESKKKLEKVNEKVDKSIKGVSNQTKLLLIIIVMICITFAAIIVYVILLGVGLVPGGIKNVHI